MKKKKHFLIISQAQFGYNTPNYYYCKYLRNDFDITYISWDFNKPKIHLDNTRLVYVPRRGIFAVRSLRFIRTVIKEIKSEKTLIYITYFKGVSTILKLLKSKNTFIFDIKTGPVKKNSFHRLILDNMMKFESKFFKHKTVISESLKNRMKLTNNIYILPMGANVISSTKKKFNKMHLLYVGTLYNRNLSDTIIGFSKFYHSNKNKIGMYYTIIGKGINNEEQVLKNLARKMEVSEVMNILGEIPHEKIKVFFDTHNIGVSYIPIIDYFDCQPPIKSFEYLLSGMPVIATNTSENKTVINCENGILIQDNSESFFRGLVRFYDTREIFDSEYIRKSSKKYSYSSVIKNFKAHLLTIQNHSIWLLVSAYSLYFY